MTFDEFASSLGWTLRAIAADRPDATEWSRDAVHFQVTIDSPRGLVWQGPYSVGSARPLHWARDAKSGRAAQLWRLYTGAGGALHGRSTVASEPHRVAIVAAYRAAAPLRIGGILECLQADAASADQPFDDWCRDLGMDSDSRKALAAYEACRGTRFALRKACGARFDEFLSIES